jgi:hypothetical protein
VRERQRCCKRQDCRKIQHKRSQKKWCQANPEYFKGRYAVTKEWRAKNPDYQRRWRHHRREIQDEMFGESVMKTVSFTIPAKALKAEIQDEMKFEIPIVIKSYGIKNGPGDGERDTR